MPRKKRVLWKKALIATDLSANSNEVVACVAKEGPDFAQKANIVHVISVETAGGLDEAIEELHKPAMELQVDMLKNAGIEASYSFAYGIPSTEINRLISEDKYQFLVLGSHSKSLVEEMLLGSVADSLISNLSVPALLIKCQGGRQAACPLVFSGKILFPTDFSDNAKAAFETLADLAGNYNPTVTLYHVQNKDTIPADLGYKIEEFNLIDTDRLNKLKETLLKAGASSVKVKIETGHGKQAIIDEINNGHYDLVVMGTQGRGWIEEVFLGDIAHAVIRNSNTSLLLVPFRK
ncbi:MAG: universal stress protein [Candidatus Margulisiibacteriota bacterium]